MLAVLLHLLRACPVWAAVKRIGKVYAAVWGNPKVVGAVEFLAVEIVDEHFMLALRVYAPKFVFGVGTRVYASVPAYIQTVGAAAVVYEHA